MAIAGNKLLNLSGAKVLYDDLRARIEGALAAGETSPTAAPHAAGDVIVVDGHLYKVTAAIAAGDTITATGAGANVTAATVAELIAAIDLTDLIDDTAGDGTTDKTWSADKILDAVAALIDDTAGDGDTGKTWSADKIHDALAALIDDTAGDGDTGKVLSADKVTNLLALKANSADVPDASGFATKENPEFTGKFSHGRRSGSTAGTRSVTIGDDNVASGEDSIAIGKGAYSSAKDSMAIGFGASASGKYQTAFGRYNSADPGETVTAQFVPGKQYYKYDMFRRSVQNGPNPATDFYYIFYECKVDHVAGESFDSTEQENWDVLTTSTSISTKARKKYLEILGNGYDADHKSNARTVDWKGNEELAGTFKCQGQITIGSITMTEANLQALLALLNT